MYKRQGCTLLTTRCVISAADKSFQSRLSTSQDVYKRQVKDEGCFLEITTPDVEGFKTATAGVYDDYLATCDPRIVEAVNAIR